MSSVLSSIENKIREILVDTAKGNLKTHKSGLITYKELWQKISRKKWGMRRTSTIVPMILKISVIEVSNRRPPLNELVVNRKIGEPGEAWSRIKRGLERTFRPNRDPHAVGLGGIGNLKVSYSSHLEAQKACWDYWGRTVDAPNVTEAEAEEGCRQDQTVTFRKRNARLIDARKRMDNFTCQACGFRLDVQGTFVIDCHHKDPLLQGERVTKIDDLMCLCPTCHRIAHRRRPPFGADEIREVRGIRAMGAASR